MKLEIFAVHDNAVGAYLPPFFCRSKGEAVRSFSDAVNSEKGVFSQHSIDYTLVYMGTYDDSGGTFDCGVPVRILGASEVKLDDPQPDRVSHEPTPRSVPKRVPM